MFATIVVVPTILIALFLILMTAALLVLLYFGVGKPLMRKYFSPWLWHRLGGKGDPPDDPPDSW